ncbi:hypothetical protein AX14_006284, partial [Amanita brunnescens Koide BX004]
LSGHRLPVSTCLTTSTICENTSSAKLWKSVKQNLSTLREISQMEHEMCAHSH